jgi:hypothetical protein
MELLAPSQDAWARPSIDEYILQRDSARVTHQAEMKEVGAVEKRRAGAPARFDPKAPVAAQTPRRAARSARTVRAGNGRTRRKNDPTGTLVPRRPSPYLDRRGTSLLPPAQSAAERRRRNERRKNTYAIPFPDRRLTRSAYEQVFLKLVSGEKLRLDDDVYTPIGMKGWYHAVFRRESDGRERLMTIDQLLKMIRDWS